MENTRTIDTLPEVLTADDLVEFLHISRSGVYNLLNSAGFPTLHIGSRKMVTKDNLLAWMQRNTDKVA